MQTRHIAYILLSAAITGCFYSCKQAEPKVAEEQAKAQTETPVTVGSISTGAISNAVSLNATSTFLQKSYVKASTNGYVQGVYTQPGKYVAKGQVLFAIKTKEAQSIGNSINVLDSTFKFSGLIKIKANQQGFISQLNHQPGDYVQDGEQLAVISDMGSFAFLLDLPYELRASVQVGQQLDLTLPDGEKLKGTVSSLMQTVDPASQTQSVVIKVNANHPIPENLIAKVNIVKTIAANTVTLPKVAVLANETQTEFWVMKMIDGSRAVKVPVTTGIESADRIEIKSPKFTATDKILISGNYGLPDTAKVKIAK